MEREQPFFSPNMSIYNEYVKKCKIMDIRIVLRGNGGDNAISHGTNY